MGMKELLEALVEVDGIKAAVVVARDGFVIEGVSDTGTLDADVLGAAVSSGLTSSDILGREMEVGRMTQGMTEYENGIIVVTPLGAEAVLAVVARLGANLGNVRYQVRKRAPQIELAL